MSKQTNKLNGKARELRRLVEHEPFVPFAVRLTNGVVYNFKERREIGAPGDFHVLVYFEPAGGGMAHIYTDEIAEILQQ